VCHGPDTLSRFYNENGIGVGLGKVIKITCILFNKTFAILNVFVSRFDLFFRLYRFKICTTTALNLLQ